MGIWKKEPFSWRSRTFSGVSIIYKLRINRITLLNYNHAISKSIHVWSNQKKFKERTLKRDIGIRSWRNLRGRAGPSQMMQEDWGAGHHHGERTEELLPVSMSSLSELTKNLVFLPLLESSIVIVPYLYKL
jgi:hypothetical protein